MERYVIREYPGSIVFFRAATRRLKYDPAEPEASWQKAALGGLELHAVGGDHISMNYPPNVRTVAERLIRRSVESGGLSESESASKERPQEAAPRIRYWYAKSASASQTIQKAHIAHQKTRI